jgi:hypothetical protein
VLCGKGFSFLIKTNKQNLAVWDTDVVSLHPDHEININIMRRNKLIDIDAGNATKLILNFES